MMSQSDEFRVYDYVRFFFVGALRMQMMEALDNVSEDMYWRGFDASPADMTSSVGDLIKTPRFYQDSRHRFDFIQDGV